MRLKIAIFCSLAAAVILLLGFWLTNGNEYTASQVQPPPAGKTALAGLPPLIIGDVKAPQTLIEYGDYQCSECNKFHHGAYPQIKRDYIDTGKVKIEFHHMAIVGPDSHKAAEASYCAADQSKFAVYHDALYRYINDNFHAAGKNGYTKGVFSVEVLTGLAQEAGLAMPLFSACLSDAKYAAAVEQSIAEGRDRGVSGTPTFFIGNQKVVGQQPYSVFQALLRAGS